jgi:gamma-glutamyl-gamma-aminobutyrate hydrolase PuuD
VTRPLIGITTYRQEAQWGVWQRPAALLPVGYVDAVAEAGGVPVLLPPVELGAPEVVAALDGLILSGGADLDPTGYGAAPHPETGEPQRLRDAWDLAVLQSGLERDLPVLAICRGMQVLNVASGGTLHQHLPEAIGHDGHRRQLGRFDSRAVRVQSGSRLQAILGDNAPVSCSHHQGVDRIGDGLVPVAWDAQDGTVEAMELADRDFVVAVQWHPEEGGQDRLFGALLAAAAAARGAVR